MSLLRGSHRLFRESLWGSRPRNRMPRGVGRPPAAGQKTVQLLRTMDAPFSMSRWARSGCIWERFSGQDGAKLRAFRYDKNFPNRWSWRRDRALQRCPAPLPKPSLPSIFSIQRPAARSWILSWRATYALHLQSDQGQPSSCLRDPINISDVLAVKTTVALP